MDTTTIVAIITALGVVITAYLNWRKSTLDEADSNFDNLMEQLKLYESRNAHLEDHIERLQARIVELSTQIDALRVENVALKNELTLVRHDLKKISGGH